MHLLERRNAVVTGASGGLGASIAAELAARGANVALVARSPERLEQVAASLASSNVSVTVVAADLSDPDDLRNVARRVCSEFGQIDLLINNAGIADLSPFQRQDPAIMRRVVEVNLLAPMMLVREVLPDMLERGRGHIVNIASLAGLIGLPYEAVYSASKAGLIAWSNALRQELDGTGVGVSVVSPGFVGKAGMFARHYDKGPRYFGLCQPEDVAGAVTRAIRRNLPEVVVNPTPVRPLLALKAVAPATAARLFRWMGFERFMRRLAGN